MILVTGATGRTGRHVIAALKAKGRPVRAFGRSADNLASLGTAEHTVGDLLSKEDLRRACEGANVLIHTGPVSEDEPIMGRWLVQAAKAAGVKHFVYHSVTHPQTEWLLNHQNKSRVEDRLIDSGLPFTILQPMHYFQNIDVRRVAETGVFASAYSTTVGLSHVDMADLAEVSATVAGDARHFYATYEICGSDHCNTEQLAEVLSERIGKPVRNEKLGIEEFVSRIPGTREGYLGDFLLRLMTYYNRYGIRGNPNVLTWLLGRTPTTFEQYVDRMLQNAATR